MTEGKAGAVSCLSSFGAGQTLYRTLGGLPTTEGEAAPMWAYGPVWRHKDHQWGPKHELPGCGSLTGRETPGQHGRGCDAAGGCRATGRLSASAPRFGSALPARTCRAGERREVGRLCRALLGNWPGWLEKDVEYLSPNTHPHPPHPHTSQLHSSARKAGSRGPQ